MTGKVFINYRREDSPAYAGWLHDQLAQKFGRDQIFRDVDAIEPGLDFVKELNAQVGKCDVLVAVIGPQWLEAPNDTGERRLDNPNDFVRIEIEAALNRDIRVIPVLVDGAKMPPEAALPDALKPLSRRHAINLSHDRFASDTAPLIRAIENVFNANIADLQKEQETRQKEATRQASIVRLEEAERGRIEKEKLRKDRSSDMAAEVSRVADRFGSIEQGVRWFGTPPLYWILIFLVAIAIFFVSFTTLVLIGVTLFGAPLGVESLYILVPSGLAASFFSTRWVKRKWFTKGRS